MAGIALVLDLLNKYPTILSRSTLHSHGFFSAKAAVSSAASSAVVAAPFAAASGFLGKGGSRIVDCDVGFTLTEDYSSSISIYKSSLQKDAVYHGNKEYRIELKPLWSGFGIAPVGLASLKFIIIFALPLLEPYLKTHYNVDFSEDDRLYTSPANSVREAVNSSVRCTFREANSTTARRMLERFVFHNFPRRTAWKFLKDASKSAARKAARGMPTYYYIYRVGKTTLRGHLLQILGTWIVNATTDICNYSVRMRYSPKRYEYERAQLVRWFKRKLALTTLRCLASLILAPIGAGVGAAIFLPEFGQCIGCLAGDFVGPVIVEFYKPRSFPKFGR